MSSMKPEVIAYLHIENMLHGKENMMSMGISKFGENWMGFVKETTYIHSEGYITKSLIPIEGNPVMEFRNAIEAAGVCGFQF